MVHLIVELSKYALIILFSVYTYECFAVFRNISERKQEKKFKRQARDFVCDSFYGIFSYICGDRGCIYFYFFIWHR